MYEIFSPKAAVLQKHVQSFFVLQEFSGPVNYLAFPQMGMTMALYNNAAIKIEEQGILIETSVPPNPQILLLGKYRLPIQIGFQEYVPEVSINFTPTGLNYFFEENTNGIAGKTAQLLASETWLAITAKIHIQDTDAAKIEMLEAFLIRILIEKDLGVVEACIALLEEDPERTIKDLAPALGVTAKTLNRHFYSYVGCAPTDFKKILRFRKAIQVRYQQPFKNLTQICFDSNFYDSPHFSREFKKLTLKSPRDFFSGIAFMGEREIPYKLL